ncbi:MAG: hypothetical protein KJ063_23325 [Anaerolineae bacterium]|nr:hypothetical protein [Anaerolineae bacterium]
MPTLVPDWVISSMFVIEAIGWLTAYILIIKHGFQEKTYGMPIIALCGNIAWEFYYSMKVFPACSVTWEQCPVWLMRGGNTGALFMDVVILYTILRYGRSKFTQPLMVKYFYPIVIFGLVTAFGLLYVVETEFFRPNPGVPGYGEFMPIHLFSGVYTGYALALEMGLLFIMMFYNRKGLEGQSFYIALGMAVGNFTAYLLNVFTNTANMTVHVLYASGAIINWTYVVLVYQRAKSMGLNPWKNF